MAGLVRWIPIRQVGPLRAGAQNPQDTVQNLAAAAPGPSASIRAPGQLAYQRFEHRPLFVGQIHRHALLLDAAYHLFMCWVVEGY